jgi:hypothetical protein
MTRRRTVWVSAAVVCVLGCGWLLTGIGQTRLAAEGVAREKPGAAAAPADDAIAKLQARVDRLERELQSVKRGGVFVGLSVSPSGPGKADAAEVCMLRELAETRLQTWRRIHALYQLGTRGGAAEGEAYARYLFQMALARLAWAEGQDKVALEHMSQAVKSADRMVEATQAAYDTGTITLDVLLETQSARADVKLTFCRMGGTLPEVAAEADRPWSLPPGAMPEPYPDDKRR